MIVPGVWQDQDGADSGDVRPALVPAGGSVPHLPACLAW